MIAHSSSESPASVSPAAPLVAALVLVAGVSLYVAPKLWLKNADLPPLARATFELQTRELLVALFLAGVLAWCALQLSRNLQSLGQVLEQGAATQAASERAAYFSAQSGETLRYANAMALLGHDMLEVRLGGIYALERLARESQADHGPIVEVLGAFVRSRASWNEGDAAPQRPAADVQAVLSVLGRRTVAFDPSQGHVDLHGTSLARAYLPFANLAGAFLYEANLEGAVLQNADLRGAWAWRARLNGAVLDGAQLQGADLTGAAGLTAPQLRAAHLDPTTKLPDYLRSEFDWSVPDAGAKPVFASPPAPEAEAISAEDLKLPSLRVKA